MITIAAIEKLVTKPRPLPVAPQKPVQEIRSTLSAKCPLCDAEIRLKLGNSADVFGGCQHFRGIEQRGDEISIQFEQTAA